MKALFYAITFALAFAATLPANAEQQRRGGTEAQYEVIQKFHDETVARFADEDLEGSVNDYLPQLRVAHTKGMTITGRDGLEKSWGNAFANPDVKPILLSEVIEMELNGDDIGDWAYILCNYASTAIDRKTGKPVSDFTNGRYIALMEMTADGWKVLLDIDNGAAGAAPHLEEQLKAQLNQ